MSGGSRPRWDGERYGNPWNEEAHGFADFLRWRILGRRTPWPAWVEDPLRPPAPEPGEGELVATFVNHATVLVRTQGLTVLTDPVFSERTSPVSWAGPKRVRRPGLALGDLPPVDVLLLSHDHYDHLDLPSLRRLGAGRPQVLCPRGVGARLAGLGFDRVAELGWWEGFVHGEARFTLTPAQHFSGRTLWDRNRTLWGGFLWEHRGLRAFFAGDTGYGPFFREIRERLGAPDLALLPIGAYAPRWFMRPVHMDPFEAVRAHLDLGARRSVGIHFGCFRLTDEGLEDPVRLLAEARAGKNVDEADFQVLPHGGWTRLALP